MRRVEAVRLLHALVAMFAWGAAAAVAQELQTTDADGGLGRLGLVGRAERIVHRGEPRLLVRLAAQDVRRIDRDNGSADWVRLRDRGLAFLPMDIACDDAVLQVGDARLKPLPQSLCTESTRIAAPFPVPLFLVFPYPKPGAATLVVPAVVLEPATRIDTRRDAPAAAPHPGVNASLLGRHELRLQVLVAQPSKK